MIPTRLLLIAGLLTVSHGAPRNQKRLLQEDQLDPKLVRLLLSNDFESGSLEPWYDKSPGETHWVLENPDSPQEPTPVPTPASGKSYARIDRPEGYVSGLAVLYTPFWTANPGDKLSLSFWIRSRHTEGNNLDIYWVNGTKEEKLLGLSSFSTSSNNQWRTAEVIIPVSQPTNITLVIYGYCGPNEEDSIAIDNIVVSPGDTSNTTSSTIMPSTTPLQTTTSLVPTTTLSPNACRYELNNSYGYITPPVGDDGLYLNNLNCAWIIKAPYWFEFIRFVFINFSTEPGRDIVRIYDGGYQPIDEIMLEHSGDVLPYTVYSSFQWAIVTFISDAANNYPGFSVFYEAF